MTPVTAMVRRAVAEAQDAAALARGDLTNLSASLLYDVSSITASRDQSITASSGGRGSRGRTWGTPGRGGARAHSDGSRSRLDTSAGLTSRTSGHQSGMSGGPGEEDSLGSAGGKTGVGMGWRRSMHTPSPPPAVARSAAASRGRLLAGLSSPPQWQEEGRGGAGVQVDSMASAGKATEGPGQRKGGAVDTGPYGGPTPAPLLSSPVRPSSPSPPPSAPGMLSTTWSGSMSVASVMVVDRSGGGGGGQGGGKMESPPKSQPPPAPATSRLHMALVPVGSITPGRPTAGGASTGPSTPASGHGPT